MGERYYTILKLYANIRTMNRTTSKTFEVASILGRSRGNEHATSPHHFDDSIEVHIVKTLHAGQGWYIKWYFLEPDSVFISVHHQ